MEIFKAYDVRGLYPSELNEENAFKIGRALATKLKNKKIFLNYDNRVGSIRIRDSLTSGLLRSGATVYELGMGPVMVSAFASFVEKSCGICISASHNPKEYTGILTYLNGITYTPDNFKDGFASKKFNDSYGKPVPFMYDGEYSKYISKGIGKLNVKIGIDSMGGATTYISNHIFQKLGAKVFLLRSSPSDDFYGKVPEPTLENSRDLAKLVKKEQLQFGIQLDADGDRALILDENGTALDPILTGMILIKYLKYKNAVATTACSSLLERYCKIKYVKTGRPNVEEALKGGHYDFGIEPSSHFYFGRYYPFSDGILTGLLIAKIIYTTGKSLSSLVAEFPKLYYKNFSISFKTAVEINKKMLHINMSAKKIGNVDTLDGVKLAFEDGFVLFRPSNTEPIIRVYYEGHNPKAFKRMGALVKIILK